MSKSKIKKIVFCGSFEELKELKEHNDIRKIIGEMNRSTRTTYFTRLKKGE